MKFEKSSAEMIAFFDAVAPKSEDIEKKKVFGYPACFVNGNMFVGLHENSFIIRLPEPDRAKAIGKEGATQFEPMPGRPMKEYIVAAPQMLENPKKLADWIARSLIYARSLPAKAKKKR